MSAPPLLVVDDLQVTVAGQEILAGCSLLLNRGEVHALLGDDGAGNRALLSAIAGHPGFTVARGKIIFDGANALALHSDERARRGIFSVLQAMIAVPGITIAGMLRAACEARCSNSEAGNGFSVIAFQKNLVAAMKNLNLDSALASRRLDENFSASERARWEIVQMETLRPSLLLLDEIDADLSDSDLQLISDSITRQIDETKMSVLLSTRSKRLLACVRPAQTHELVNGRIGAAVG